MNKIKIMAFALSGLLVFTGCTSEAYPKSDYSEKKAESVNYIIAGRVISTNSDISSKLSGKVSEIMVKEGESVKEGDVLLRVESKELEAQLMQAQSGVLVAQANYEKVKSGARKEQKTQAKAAFESAKKSEELAKTNYERSKLLYESGGLSKQQLETSEMQLQSASSQRVSAQAQMDIINQGESKETLAVLQAQVEQAKAASNSIKVQLDNQLVKAPYDGVVSKKYIEKGEMAAAGSKLFTIQGKGNLKIEGNLPESLIGKVSENDAVVVRFPDLSKEKEYKGIVSMVNPALDNSGKGDSVEIIISQADDSIKTGMFAEVGLKK